MTVRIPVCTLPFSEAVFVAARGVSVHRRSFILGHDPPAQSRWIAPFALLDCSHLCRSLLASAFRYDRSRIPGK